MINFFLRLLEEYLLMFLKFIEIQNAKRRILVIDSGDIHLRWGWLY